MTALGHVAATTDLHPWNTTFEWEPPTGAPRRLTAEQRETFVDQGYLLVEGGFDAHELEAVRSAIEPHERAVNRFLQQCEDGRLEVAEADALTVVLHPSTVEAACRSFVGHRVFAELCSDLVGPDVRLYWDQAVYKLPHMPEPVPWHQDNGYVYVEPQAYLTCWVPLVDSTVDNGGVWVVPGAHRRGTLAHWPTDRGWRCLPESVEGAVAVEAPAGSVVVFSSLTPHRTGPNRTDDVRAAYILQYAPDGAHVLRGDPAAGTGTPDPQDDRRRQIVVVSGGEPAAPPPLA